MSILRPIRDYLREGIDIANKLGHPDYGVRIYAGRVPQGVPFPAVTVKQISGQPNEALADESNLATAIIEFQSYEYKEPKAFELLDLIRLRPFSHYRGYVGTASHGRAWIDSCTIETGTVINRNPEKGSDRWVFQGTVTYLVFYDRVRPIGG